MKPFTTVLFLILLSLTSLRAQQVGETPDGTLQFRSRITGITNVYSTTAWSAARLNAKVDLSAYNTFRATQAATDAAQNTAIDSRLPTTTFNSFTTAQAATNASLTVPSATTATAGRVKLMPVTPEMTAAYNWDAFPMPGQIGSYADEDVVTGRVLNEVRRVSRNFEEDMTGFYLPEARNRANHTGTQPISTVAGLQTSLDGKVNVGPYTTFIASQTAIDQQQNSDILARLTTSTFNSFTTAQANVNAVKLNVSTFNSFTTAYSNYTATQSSATVPDATTATAGKVKLAPVEGGILEEWPTGDAASVATSASLFQLANQTYNELSQGLNNIQQRINHLGEQPISTVTGLQSALDGKVNVGPYTTFIASQTATNQTVANDITARLLISTYASYTAAQAAINTSKANISGGNSLTGNQSVTGSVSVTGNVTATGNASFSNVTTGGNVDARTLLLGNTSNSFQQASGFVMNPGTQPLLRPATANAGMSLGLNDGMFTRIVNLFTSGNLGIRTNVDNGQAMTVAGSFSVTGAVTLAGPVSSSAISNSITAAITPLQTQISGLTSATASLQSQINSLSASAGTGGNANVIFVNTPTVAALNQAIALAPAGSIVRPNYKVLTFGDAESVVLQNKASLTLDLNSCSLVASQSRTMIYLLSSLTDVRLTGGHVINNSPTLLGGSYGWYGTISSLEDTQLRNVEIDHLTVQVPNADENAFLFVQYRDVPGNFGGTALMEGVNMHDLVVGPVGRMGIEIINGGPNNNDFTTRYRDVRITNSRFFNLGRVNSNRYGMAVSLDGPGERCVVSTLNVTNARTVGIELVNTRDATVQTCTIIDEPGELTGCTGISITDNRRFITERITVTGNVVNVKGRGILVRDASEITATGNRFLGVEGSNFITKRSNFQNNRFHATAPTGPVVTFEASSASGTNWWTSTENMFTGNTVTNWNPSKPSGYSGPFQLVRYTSGSQWNVHHSNFLIRDPSASAFAFREFINNSAESSNYVGADFTRTGRDLGFGDKP